MAHYCIVLLLAFGIIASTGGQDFSYIGFNGPFFWNTLFQDSCGGSAQSPIDLSTLSCLLPSTPNPGFTFSNYDTVQPSMIFENNGLTAELHLPSGSVAPSVTGGELGAEYKFEQLHFHWGINSLLGSEHTVDLVRFPLEMHLVHYKGTFSNFSDAVASGEPDALAVLGVFFRVSLRDNPDLEPIIEELSNIRDSGDEVTISPGVSLESLLPRTNVFFRYSGSLTTPRCNEIVTWTVFKDTVPISLRQLLQFRFLRDPLSRPLVNNFRPLQLRRSRTVTCYRELPTFASIIQRLLDLLQNFGSG